MIILIVPNGDIYENLKTVLVEVFMYLLPNVFIKVYKVYDFVSVFQIVLRKKKELMQ